MTNDKKELLKFMTPKSLPFYTQARVISHMLGSAYISPVAFLSALFKSTPGGEIFSKAICEMNTTKRALIESQLDNYISVSMGHKDRPDSVFSPLGTDSNNDSVYLYDLTHRYVSELSRGTVGATALLSAILNIEGLKEVFDDMFGEILGMKSIDVLLKFNAAELSLYSGDCLAGNTDAVVDNLIFNMIKDTVINSDYEFDEFVSSIDYESGDCLLAVNPIIEPSRTKLYEVNFDSVLKYRMTCASADVVFRIMMHKESQKELVESIRPAVQHLLENSKDGNEPSFNLILVCRPFDIFDIGLDMQMLSEKYSMTVSHFLSPTEFAVLTPFMEQIGMSKEQLIKMMFRVAPIQPELYTEEVGEKSDIVHTWGDTEGKGLSDNTSLDEVPDKKEVNESKESEAESAVTEEARKALKRVERLYSNKSEKSTMRYVFGSTVLTQKQADDLCNLKVDSWGEYSDKISRMIVRSTKRALLFVGPTGIGKSTFMKYEVYRRNILDKESAYCDVHGVNYIAHSFDIHPTSATKEEIQSCFAQLQKKLHEKDMKPIIFADDFADGRTPNQYGVKTCVYLARLCRQLEYPLVGTCTEEEYAKYLANEPEISRNFEIVRFKEPTMEGDGLEMMISNYFKCFENNTHIAVPENVIRKAMRLADKYDTESCFPEKAITLIDGAISNSYAYKPRDLDNASKEDFPALSIDSEEPKLSELTEEQLVEYATEKYDVPIMVEDNQWDDVNALKDKLSSTIIGQDEAIDTFIRQWKLHKAGLTEENKPIGSFLFVGPTGVGKTELTKRIAEFTGKKLIRFDMSEYSEAFTPGCKYRHALQ